VSRLNGELVQISILHEDQRQFLEDQEASYLKLQREAEETRQSLEVEKKQVEGKFAFIRFSFVNSFSVLLIFPSRICSDLDLPCSWFPGLRTAMGHMTNQAETVSAAYNSAEQELGELRAAALETCQAVEEGKAQAGSSLASRLRALGRHVSSRMRRALHLGVQKALGVVGVGDSPRGPLKQQGNPHLKPATMPKHDLPNPAGNSPRHRDPDGPSRRPS
jgi:F0F1-type ATP synthase membrane subunit b/b'